MRKKTEIIDRNKLVDIRDVVIDTDLPKEKHPGTATCTVPG